MHTQTHQVLMDVSLCPESIHTRNREGVCVHHLAVYSCQWGAPHNCFFLSCLLCVVVVHGSTSLIREMAYGYSYEGVVSTSSLCDLLHFLRSVCCWPPNTHPGILNVNG